MNNASSPPQELTRLLDRLLPEVFPMNATSLEVMREVGKLHRIARDMLADAKMGPELREILQLPDGEFQTLIRRAIEREGVIFEHMAPHQIVWHTLVTARELRGLLG